MFDSTPVGRPRRGALVKMKKTSIAPVTKLVIDWAGKNVKKLDDGRHVTELVCRATHLSGEKFCKVLERLGNAVEVIDLSGSGFDDSVLDAITACNFTRLRVFRAGDCNFSDTSLVEFLERRGATLEELDLSGSI